MLIVPVKKRTRRTSKRQAIAKGYMLSGDLFGNSGLKSIENRRARKSIHNDSRKLAEDWAAVGNDIQHSMDKYKEEYLNHEQ